MKSQYFEVCSLEKLPMLSRYSYTRFAICNCKDILISALNFHSCFKKVNYSVMRRHYHFLWINLPLPCSVSATLPTGQLSNVPWRRSGVKYTNNEAYFDVTEEVDAIIDKSGGTVAAEIQGYVSNISFGNLFNVIYLPWKWCCLKWSVFHG